MKPAGDNEHPDEPVDSLEFEHERERMLPPLEGPQPDVTGNEAAEGVDFPPIPPTQPAAVVAVFGVKPINAGDANATTDGPAAHAALHTNAA